MRSSCTGGSSRTSESPGVHDRRSPRPPPGNRSPAGSSRGPGRRVVGRPSRRTPHVSHCRGTASRSAARRPPSHAPARRRSRRHPGPAGSAGKVDGQSTNKTSARSTAARPWSAGNPLEGRRELQGQLDGHVGKPIDPGLGQGGRCHVRGAGHPRSWLWSSESTARTEAYARSRASRSTNSPPAPCPFLFTTALLCGKSPERSGEGSGGIPTDTTSTHGRGAARERGRSQPGCPARGSGGASGGIR